MYIQTYPAPKCGLGESALCCTVSSTYKKEELQVHSIGLKTLCLTRSEDDYSRRMHSMFIKEGGPKCTSLRVFPDEETCCLIGMGGYKFALINFSKLALIK